MAEETSKKDASIVTLNSKPQKAPQIVKIDNSFNMTHAFDRLNAELQNIAWAIISSFSTGDSKEKPIKTELKITGAEIRKLSGITGRHSMTHGTYEELLNKLRNFFLTQYFVVHLEEIDDEGIKHYIEHGQRIFDSFDIIDHGERVDIKIALGATRLFTHIFPTLGFSVFALQNMINLKKPTAKTLYRLFLDGNHIHGWTAYRDEFEKIFGFKKKSSAWSSFLRRLDSYLADIKSTGDFAELDYDRLVDTSQRGHPVVAVDFHIKLKKGRLNALLNDYDPNKPRKSRPVFYPLSITKNVYDTKLVSDSKKVIGIQSGHKKIIDIKCPNCGSTVVAFKQKDGKIAFCCDNNKFWGLGGRNCNFYCLEDQTERQTKDIQKWLADVRKAAGEKSLADYIAELDAKAKEQVEQVDQEEVEANKNVAYDSNNPFGFSNPDI